MVFLLDTWHYVRDTRRHIMAKANSRSANVGASIGGDNQSALRGVSRFPDGQSAHGAEHVDACPLWHTYTGE